MEVIFADKFSKIKKADMDIIPQKGDKIAWYYEP